MKNSMEEYLHFDDQSKQVVSIFFFSLCFLEEIENMFSVFLSSYRSTRESLGELERAVETLAYGSCSHSISRSPKIPLLFLQLDRITVHIFYFLSICPHHSRPNSF